jgi:hypothetical protein
MSEISDRDGEMVDERDQEFERLLGEVEASRSTETRDQLKEKLNKLYAEVNKLYDEANKQFFCQVRVIARELAISAEDPAEARHYADLVLHADAFGLISEEEEHAELAVIRRIRWQEGRDVRRSYDGDFLRPRPAPLSKEETH